MSTITTVFGTRPEIIKMAPLIPLLDKNFDHRFVFSGQHFSDNMVHDFFKDLGVRQPDSFLNTQSGEYTKLLPELKKEMKNDKSKYVIVYGDTNSTLAATLAAEKYHKELIHIEAGLRSFDHRLDEELTRTLVDHLSGWLFPPTTLCEHFLKEEGIINNVHVVGNTVVDALNKYLPVAEKKSDVLERLGVKKDEYVLATVHRAENTDDIQKMTQFLRTFAGMDYPVLTPIHPRVKRRLMEFGLKKPKNLITPEPLNYFDMLVALKNCKFVMTDSGGVQEEAITLGIPCITLRETTERWETIAAGANVLVGSDPILIKYNAKMIVETDMKKKIEKIKNPYGDGNASKKIVDILKKELV